MFQDQVGGVGLQGLDASTLRLRLQLLPAHRSLQRLRLNFAVEGIRCLGSRVYRSEAPNV